MSIEFNSVLPHAIGAAATLLQSKFDQCFSRANPFLQVRDSGLLLA